MTGLYDTPRPTVRIRFEPQGVEVEVPEGRVLMAAARQAGVHIEAPCGGQGWCGRCRVVATGELSAHTPDELRLLRPDDLADSVRLACRARALGDVVVRVPAAEGAVRVVEAGGEPTLALEPPEARGLACGARCAGAAVDVGTTTLALELVDLRTGDRLGRASALNPQVRFGADVLSRVSHALTREGARELRSTVLGEVERLLLGSLEKADVLAEDLVEVVLAGNTAMTHLALGVDVSPLAAAPYEGALVEAAVTTGEAVGFTSLLGARVVTMPAVSAFIGGDVAAGMLATSLPDREAPTVFIDLGTNGEIVLATPDGLIAASTAAGPALEGAALSHGIRAEAGAIERVALVADRLELDVIGGEAPRGICGSGLLDLTAALLDAGALDSSGRLQPAGPLASQVEDAEGGRRLRVADGVYLTQQDVRQVQLSKGAVTSGISLLMEASGLAEDAVEEVVFAGGFGLHVRPAALARVGMIPRVWADRVSFAGNTSLEGAAMALASSAVRKRAEELARKVRTVDLAAHPAFEQRFLKALDFPLGW